MLGDQEESGGFWGGLYSKGKQLRAKIFSIIQITPNITKSDPCFRMASNRLSPTHTALHELNVDRSTGDLSSKTYFISGSAFPL